MRKKGKRAKAPVTVKSAVCAVTAFLCLAQPVLGAEFSAGKVSVNQEASGNIEISMTSKDIPQGAKISSEQAEQTVRAMFPELSKAKLSNVLLQEADLMGNRAASWELNYSYQRGRSTTGFSVTVDAITNEVMSYYLPSMVLTSESGQDGEVEITREGAREKAISWIQKHVKSVNAGSLKENKMYGYEQNSLFSQQSYNFYFNVPVNGIFSDSNSISITVDQQGRVLSYSRSKFIGEIPSSVPKLAAEAARKQFEKDFRLELAYVPAAANSRTSAEYFLGYVPSDRSMWSIDAQTGGVINSMGTAAALQPLEPRVVPEQKEKFAPAAKPLSNAEDAVRLVEANFSIPKEYKAQYKHLQDRYSDGKSKVWRITWEDSSTPVPYGGRQISAEVDAKTGQVYSYYSYSHFPASTTEDPKPAAGKEVTQEQAEQAAFRAAARLVPGLSEKWRLSEVVPPDPKTKKGSFNYSFTRYEGDIRVVGDYLSISIDLSGNIAGFNNVNSSDAGELPKSARPVVTPEEAKQMYFKALELQLRYNQYGGYYMDNEGIPYSLKLVYSPVRNDSEYNTALPIDATTGKWRPNVLNLPSQGQPAVAADTAGHPSQPALDKLVAAKVLIPDEEGKVHPNQVLTAGEWFDWVARAANASYDLNYYGSSERLPYGDLSTDSPYFNAVETLVSYNWLPVDPEPGFSTERRLTRDELARLLMKMLKYERLGQTFNGETALPGIQDTNQITNRGAALIAMKLGLLPAVDGRFLPSKEVTRAEAAQVLVSLAKLSGKSDSFMTPNW